MGTWRVLYRVPSQGQIRGLFDEYLDIFGSYGRLTMIYLILLRSEILGSGIEVLDLDLDLDLDLGPGPGSGPDWLQDRPLRISYLRYTGFKGVLLASEVLRLRRPRIG